MTRRVLIVEDEMLVSLMLEDAVSALGFEVAGSASHFDDALARVEAGGFDFAILDVNLGGKAIYPVADILIARGVPFVFATGYGEGGLPEKYRSRPILQKPFLNADLEQVLNGG